MLTYEAASTYLFVRSLSCPLFDNALTLPLSRVMSWLSVGAWRGGHLSCYGFPISCKYAQRFTLHTSDVVACSQFG